MSLTGKAIYTLLDSDSTISATGAEISPNWVTAESTLPYISYRLVSKFPIMTKDDPIMDMETYQISVFSKTYDEAVTLSGAARSVLEGSSGTSEGSSKDHKVLTKIAYIILQIVTSSG